jgi:hypothetical protein
MPGDVHLRTNRGLGVIESHVRYEALQEQDEAGGVAWMDADEIANATLGSSGFPDDLTDVMIGGEPVE